MIGLIGLLALLVGCKPKTEDTEPLVSIQLKGGEIVLVDPQTNEPLKVTPCVSEAEGKERAPTCAIFDSEFKTLQIAQINLILSEKKTNSVACAITFIVDGRSYQFTYDFPDLNACPKDWFRI